MHERDVSLSRPLNKVTGWSINRHIPF